MNNRWLHWLMQVGMFLLRGAGWAAIGIFVGFIVSYFFRLPGRVDTFALTETLLGVVITGLSIVGAFMVVLQWSTLDNRLSTFAISAKETKESLDLTNGKAVEIQENFKILMNESDRRASIYDEKSEKLDIFIKDSIKAQEDISALVEKFQVKQIKREEDFEKRQKDLIEREKELKEIAMKVEEAAKSFKVQKDDNVD